MSAPNIISIEKLVRLIGTPKCPILVDVRPPNVFEADPHLIPSSFHCGFDEIADEMADRVGERGEQSAIVICQNGTSLSQGAAALLRDQGVPAEVLEGGFEAWKQEKLPLVPFAKLPPVDTRGRTVWVTRARPKIDRIACPWLIRRFVDPRAAFLFVAPSDVVEVAERFGGVPFDIENVFWSHRGDTCTFDTMIEEFGLRHSTPASPGDDGSRSGYRAPGTFATGSRLACGITWPLPHVCGRSGTTRSRDAALRRLLSLVPRCHRRDPQLAHQ